MVKTHLRFGALGAALVLTLLMGGWALAGIERPPVGNPAPALTHFTFAVAGDNRGEIPIQQPEVFKRILRELEVLRPRFVLGTGDLILGYEGEEHRIRAEWEEFIRVVNEISVPYYPLVGNHDVWDEQSRRIWDELFGPTYFSFDYGNCHFVCLDSEAGAEGQLFLPEQLQWLERDLASHQDAEHIIVALHVPFWSYEDDSPLWKRDVHPLLVKYGVDFVTGGHTHGYEEDVLDGITYVVSGGAGAQTDANEATGGFHHYLLVNVAGPELTFAMIKPGAIEPPDYVLPSDRPIVEAIEQNLLPSAVVRVGPGGLEQSGITLTFRSPLGQLHAGAVEWVVPGANWVIYPQAREYSLAPGESVDLHFSLALPDPREANPPPYYTTKVPIRPDKVFQFKGRLGAEKHAVCPRTETPPTIDGVASEEEWRGAAVLENFALVRGGPSGWDPRVLLVRDESNLYIGAHLNAPPLLVFRRPDRIIVDLDADPTDSPCVEVQFLCNGTVRAGRVDPVARTQEWWDLTQAGRIVVEENGWGGEVAIPLAGLAFKVPVEGARVAVNAWSYCNQGGRYEQAIWCWLPGAEYGQRRFGVLEFE